MKKVRGWLLICLLMPVLWAEAQDTIEVQTLVFDSITMRRGTWQFPEGESFRKILMYHTLKCDPRTTHDHYNCGEWDYLTYNTVWDHTGVYDSTLYHQPSFTYINGATMDLHLERSDPTYNYYNKLHRQVTYSDTVSLNQALIGTGSLQSSAVLNTQFANGRSQFIWKQQELAGAGLVAGDITGIRLHVEQSGAAIRHLTIRMKQVTTDTLTTGMLFTGLETVCYNGWQMPDSGWAAFPFYESFAWDGTSNILVDISYEQSQTGNATAIFCDDPGFNCGITTTEENYALDFDGEMDFVMAPPDVYFHGNLTFETWFNKRNNNKWSRVFDFGNGPNQSNFIVTFSNNTSGKLSVHVNNENGVSKYIITPDPVPLNEWTHFAVTMTHNRIAWVYLNGDSLFVNVLQDPDSVVRNINYIGRSNWTSDRYADAMIDELRIYNGTRTPAQIRHDMLHAAEEPLNDPDLYLYYRFNEGAGEEVNDGSLYAHHGRCYGLPGWFRLPGPDMHGDFMQNNERPQIYFDQLEATNMVIDTLIVRDSIMNSPVQLILFDNPDNPPVATDTISVYRSEFTYVYQQGIKVDSVWNDYDTVRHREMIPYYGEPFEVLEKYEIGRYITPYGIGLSLGNEGFKWVYDVTDYASLLEGQVDLSAGNQQELIDLKFVMIKGKPPRDALKMDRIWGPRKSYKYKDMASDTVLKATNIHLEQDASQFRVRARLTGHGHNSNTGNYPHCCEWKDNTHYLLVNGVEVSAWHIFQYHDCGLNPVYPQGGTWPGARGGWCPGDLVKVHDVEITQIIPDFSVNLDYDITPVPVNNLGMGNGNYVVDMMLFQYGENHFETDAEVYEVIMPTTYEYHSRVNPTCTDPTIVIRNNGTSNLTSLQFSYGVSGGEQQSFAWEGNLPSHRYDTVVLPVPGGSFWFGDTLNRFQVCVSDPNGTQDEYADNDCYETSFVIPDMYNETIVLKLKTNKQAYRFSLSVTDIEGNEVLSRPNLANDSLYTDTLNIPNGCYTILLLDEEDMGLTYWAYPEQGSGSFKIYDLDDKLLKYFDPEFGRMIKYSFMQGDISYIAEPNIGSDMLVYPNPADDVIHVRCDSWPDLTKIKLVDMKGTTLYETNLKSREQEQITIQTGAFMPGLYLLIVSDETHIRTQKVIIQ